MNVNEIKERIENLNIEYEKTLDEYEKIALKLKRIRNEISELISQLDNKNE